METTFNSHSGVYDEHRHMLKAKAKLWIVPVARFIFSLIFLIAGFTHFSSGSVSYAASKGIPLPDVLVPVSGIIALVGSISVMLGIHARVGAVLLLIFLIPITFFMHDFWNISDPMIAQNEMSHFLKNLTMIGGALLIAFYGSGPVSFDLHRARKNVKNKH